MASNDGASNDGITKTEFLDLMTIKLTDLWEQLRTTRRRAVEKMLDLVDQYRESTAQDLPAPVEEVVHNTRLSPDRWLIGPISRKSAPPLTQEKYEWPRKRERESLEDDENGEEGSDQDSSKSSRVEIWGLPSDEIPPDDDEDVHQVLARNRPEEPEADEEEPEVPEDDEEEQEVPEDPKGKRPATNRKAATGQAKRKATASGEPARKRAKVSVPEEGATASTASGSKLGRVTTRAQSRAQRHGDSDDDE